MRTIFSLGKAVVPPSDGGYPWFHHLRLWTLERGILELEDGRGFSWFTAHWIVFTLLIWRWKFNFFGTCGKSQHLVINLIFFCPDSPMKTRDRDRLHSEALQSGSSHQDILRSHTVSPCHTTHPAQDQTDQKVAAVPEMEQSEVKRWNTWTV